VPQAYIFGAPFQLSEEHLKIFPLLLSLMPARLIRANPHKLGLVLISAIRILLNYTHLPFLSQSPQPPARLNHVFNMSAGQILRPMEERFAD
jgi:hypothetical protein